MCKELTPKEELIKRKVGKKFIFICEDCRHNASIT
jgi:hypothetical protein